MSYSTILIIPATYLDAANAVGEAMNWGPTSYTIPLSKDGETVTHYGLHHDMSPEFFAMMANPPEIEGVGAVLDALIVSAPGSPVDPEGVPYASPTAHLAAVCEEHDLLQVPG